MNHRRAVRGGLRLLIVACALSLGLTLASNAGAGTYFGFNFLTPNSPTQCSTGWGYGCAQGGFNNWWTNQIEITSGGCTEIGFRDTGGMFYYAFGEQCHNPNTPEPEVYQVTRTDAGVQAPPYNRPFCAFSSGNSSYSRCTVFL